MLHFLNQMLFSFRDCFTRTATFQWFVVVIAGFISRTDQLGVTSIVRGLLLFPNAYEKLLNFFHSNAWDVETVLKRWWHLALQTKTAVEVNGKLVLLADHTKIPKEGRKMPGVSTLHQDSETSSKPSFFRGHFWGTVSLLTGREGSFFSTPLWSSIHQKLNLKEVKEDTVPSTERLVNMALTILGEVRRNGYLLLDAFFSAGPVFAKAGRQSPGSYLTVITPAKSNTKGYLPIDKKKRKKGRGKPRKYGDKIAVNKMFQYWSGRFETATAEIYGHSEEIRYYAKSLFWKPIRERVLFVWAETSIGRIVLMCSDLNETPVNVIELYCKRAKIETFFSILKNVFGGHQYHFWSKYLVPSSRRPKKNQVKRSSSNPEKTKSTYEAIHRFFNLQCIAIGILQMIALKFHEAVTAKSNLWLRTPSKKVPSEFVAKAAIKNIIIQCSIKLSRIPMIQIIREKQKEPDFDENLKEAA